MSTITMRHTRHLVAVVALLFSAPVAGAQTLEHVREFWGFTDVQFLPGGYVVVADDGGTRRYVYKNSKFERVQDDIPAVLKDWTAFDWTVDYLDQVDASDALQANLRALLPRRARVKEFYNVDLPDNRGSLVLICYTRRLRIEGANAKDIFVTAAVNTNPRDAGSRYHKLWSRKLIAEANYGDFQYQVIPGAGKFFLLYSAAIGGDAIEHHLDVYRLKGL